MLTRTLVAAFMAIAVQGAQNDGISMEPPVLPQVANISFTGVGCSQGTANASWSTVNWSDWVVSLHDLNLEAIAGTPDSAGAASSPGRPPSESDCTIHAEFSHASPGWQLALEAVSIRGYAALSSGSSISAAASVSWSSPLASTPASSGHNTVPPVVVERNVSLTNSRTTDEASAMGAMLDFSSVPVWSDCSTATELGSLTLSLRFGVHVRPNTTGGYAAFGGLVDDGHGEISAAPAVVQRLQWAWRPCKVPVATMGSTTFFPKPKTTTKPTATATNSTAWTTTASANSTAATATTKSAQPFPPFSNSTSVTSSNPTSKTQSANNTNSSSWTTSKSENTTVVKTTTTATTTTTSTQVKSSPTPVYFNTTTSTPIKELPPTTLSTITTSTRSTANETTSTWTLASNTTEQHWTTSTTEPTTGTPSSDRITGSTWQTSVTGTSFSFSFIDDPPTTTSTATAPLTTTFASGWHNSTKPANTPTSATTSTPPWRNSTSTGGTSRSASLPTHS